MKQLMSKKTVPLGRIYIQPMVPQGLRQFLLYKVQLLLLESSQI